MFLYIYRDVEQKHEAMLDFACDLHARAMATSILGFSAGLRVAYRAGLPPHALPSPTSRDFHRCLCMSNNVNSHMFVDICQPITRAWPVKHPFAQHSVHDCIVC